MANYDIEPTFSNDESMGYPPPPPPPLPPPSYPCTDGGDETFSDEPSSDVELDANEDQFEQTLSELEIKAGPFEEYDSADDSTIESQAESTLYEKGPDLVKKRNSLALLAFVLMVIVAILGSETRSRNQAARDGSREVVFSEANAAITEDSAAIVAPTEPLVTEPPEDIATEEASSCMSIFDLACSTDGLETLCALIVGACTTPGLEAICDTIGELGGPGPYTVFAPSNSAFDMLSLATKTSIQNPEVLSDILLYHVIEGKVLAADLVCDSEVTMANMEVTTTLCENGDFYQSGPRNFDVLPKIVRTDVNACNGVVHVIDQVILTDANDSFEFPSPNPPNFPRPNLDMNPGDMHPGSEHDPYPPNNDGDQCQDEVYVSKQCYIFGEPIEVTYKSCSPGAHNWMGVFRQGSSDRFGRMRQGAAYWELPCGGHGQSCTDPVDYGTITMNSNLGPGRYQVYGFIDMNQPYLSNTSSQTFVIGQRCHGSLPSRGPLSPNHQNT